MRILCALTVPIVLVIAASTAGAFEPEYRYPIKVRVSGMHGSTYMPNDGAICSRRGPDDWGVAAGQARSEILCARRGYAFALGMRPFFSNLSGMTKVVSKGGEGTYLNLGGHLRIPTENTLWEFYAALKLWDRIAVNLEYVPWYWSGSGHSGADGNFDGLLLHLNDSIQSDLDITQYVLGGEYDVAFGRDLVFGPNADFRVIKWRERVGKDTGESADHSQTILEPSIGAHVRYEPLNTGYFSWFKPYMEGRFTWMSFYGLGLSTWDMGAGVAPPVSRNVDAGFKLGYKQWKLDGNRGRLFLDVTVEGPYLDFALRF